MRAPRMLLSRLLVVLRVPVAATCIGGAVAAAILLPPISNSGGGSLTALVPKHAPALRAEQISAAHFGFPILSQTIVVVRNPRGLSTARQAQLVGLAKRLSFGTVPGFPEVAGALPLANTLGVGSVTRERGTTVLLYLFFHQNLSTYARAGVAHRLIASQIGHRRGEFEGLTAQAPAQVTRANLINSHLKWVELATIILVALAIGVHFRAVGAALLTVAAVAAAYVLADRLVEKFGTASGVSVPSEIQPVLVVLVFGIVTDYSVFFLSRFRRLLQEGLSRREAGIRVIHQISPIVAVAGTTVAAGTAALLVAHLEFLRGVGPGLAIAVLIAMIVAVLLVPTVLAVGGARMYWPHRPEVLPAPQRSFEGPTPQPETRRRRVWAVRFAVRHPLVAIVAVLALVLGAASGLLRIALGNELILGLSAGSSVHRAYVQASDGFSPGVLAPTVVVVTGPGVGSQRDALGRLGRMLAAQPDVDKVVGPGDQPTGRRLGVTIAKTGNAARYALLLRTNPLGARGISATRHLIDRLPALMRSAGLRGARGLVAGDSALSADSVQGTLSDLARVTPAVLLAIFIVISIFLRALVAPLYLVLTSALSALAALGLTVYALQIGLGYDQITYYVLFVAAVLLVSLGSDYNVFLVGRIWQEARRRPLREAIETGGSGASRPITVAGFVLALSFALLAIVPVRSFREIAFAVAVGLMIDAFIVRTVLVPALMSIVGVRSGWPSRRLRGGSARRASAGRRLAVQPDAPPEM